MTITGGSAIPKEDIDRMIKDAEAHAEEDKARRAEAEARNQAEGLAYTMEKQIADNRDKLPADVVETVEADIAEVKKALEGEDADAVKAASDKLTQSSMKIGEALYAAQAAEAEAAGDQASPEGDAGQDDVVDAEIVEED